MTTTKRLYRPRLLDVDYVRAEYAVRSMLLRHGRRVRLFRQGGAPARLLLVDAQFRVGIRTSRPGERDTGDCSLGVGAGTPSAGVCCTCRGILRSSAGEWLDAILQFVHIRSR